MKSSKKVANKGKTKRAKAAPLAAPSTVLILRTCDAKLQARDGFQWPESGPVEARDWKPTNQCGNGLHGLLWGEGDGTLLNWEPEARWLVVEVPAGSTVDLAGKVKFPRGVVAFCGERVDAVAYLKAHGAAGRCIVGDVVGAGDRGTATAGYRGTATAGDRGTATAGDRGTATAGDRGTATAGESGTATAGYRGTATAGDRGTATAGYRGTATAGYRGTATAGDRGTATAGYRGTATAGDRGTATAGESGVIVISWCDEKRRGYRRAVAEVGESVDKAGAPIKPKTKYQVNNTGQFVEVAGLDA